MRAVDFAFTVLHVLDAMHYAYRYMLRVQFVHCTLASFMQRDIFFQFAEQNVNAINRYTKVLYFIVCRLKKGRRDENAIESRYKRDKIKHVSF